MSRDLHLISFDICPFVERSRVVLEEKDVDYRSTDIDLSDKPDWFLEISPRGKVPVLVVDDEPVFESNVINELLEELYPEPSLFPEEPMERARARSWMAFVDNDLLGPVSTLYFEKDDEEALDEARTDIRDGFDHVEEQLARHDGPYFLEKGFTLVDAAIAPIFTRWPIAEKYGHDDLLDGYEELPAYRDAVVERDSVRAARDDELIEKIEERY